MAVRPLCCVQGCMRCPLAPPSPVYRARGSSKQSFLLALPGGIPTGNGHQAPCPGTAGAPGGLVRRMWGCFAVELGGLTSMTATSRHSRGACSHHVSLGGRRRLSITCRGSWPMRGRGRCPPLPAGEVFAMFPPGLHRAGYLRGK